MRSACRVGAPAPQGDKCALHAGQACDGNTQDESKERGETQTSVRSVELRALFTTVFDGTRDCVAKSINRKWKIPIWGTK